MASKKKPKPRPAPRQPDPPPSKRFPVVGVGASAGGLEALEELFRPMPADTGMAFVVITHQHPGHASLLPELLGKVTALPVVAAEDGMPVEPNRIHVSTPGGYLAILGGRLHRMDADRKEAPHLPIDYFFRSLADDQQEKAIGVILSGTGTDGTLGLKAIKGGSGMAMVQSPLSAKYAGMPSSAIATGLADFELAAPEMAEQLVAYARGPYIARPLPAEAAAEIPEPMQKIFLLLRNRTGHDFSSYKSTTIRRRIERRMNLHQIDSPAGYVRFIEGNPHELDILFKELLISVTNFFRDPEAFEVLEKTALPALIASRGGEYGYRFWVAGCATGEEVFSLAILMRECLGDAASRADVQVFGTDLDHDAIDTARAGVYPEGISRDLTPERLQRYFTREDSSYRIRKEIREMAIFAVQNVIKDPPFTKLDLISCRNLLIYLNSDLQRRLLPIFHYALKPGGLLFLGSSESIGPFADLFEVVDKKWKIFRRKEAVPAIHPVMTFPALPPARDPAIRPATMSRPAREPNIASAVDHLLLARFAPSSAVVTDRGEVVYIHGRTGNYLEPSSGQPRNNILDMAREGLQLELASALRQAVSRDHEVVREGIQVKTNGHFTRVDLSVTRIQEPESLRGLLLVSFRPRPDLPDTPEESKAGEPDDGRVRDLERELKCTKESLQTTIEELETANEELKSANEELQSTNEELQSTNEEMETAKEEMQSLNEELTTVNAEMQSKVDDLSRTNDDMQNLLNSTEVATIFLDRDLNIKRYTEQARELINLIQTDVGRPLGDLVSRLAYDRLVADCRDVLRTLVFKVTEVRTTEGRWYLMRIMPYRTAENVIDGVVVTFVDINPVKTAEKSLLRMSKVFQEGPVAMMILDCAGTVIEANDEAVQAWEWTREELAGRSFLEILADSSGKAAEDLLGRCSAGEIIRKMACVFATRSRRESPGFVTLKLLADESGRPDAICLIAETSVS